MLKVLNNSAMLYITNKKYLLIMTTFCINLKFVFYIFNFRIYIYFKTGY